jgi:hypothetical protein
MPPKSASSSRAKAKAAEEDKPEEVTEPEPVSTKMRAGGGTSNESPALPATVQSGAARAHGMSELLEAALAEGDTGRAQALAGRIREELARYVPDELADPGRAEAARVASTEL